MDLFSIFENVLNFTFYLSLRETIPIILIIFHIGYFFGQIQSSLNQDNEDLSQQKSTMCMLAIKCAQTEDTSHECHKEKYSEPFHQPSPKTFLENSLHLSSSQTESEINKPRLTHTVSEPQKLPVPQPEQNNLSREFLSQKISVDGRRIQSRGIFHMTFEKANNPKFLRKIEKHQIITDYEIAADQGQAQGNQNNLQLIPFTGGRKSFQLTDDSSILEISTYENLRLQKYPIVEKRLIKTHQFASIPQTNNNNTDQNTSIQPYIPVSASLCENGKFTKFFKNQRKIGEGAFGTVYQVMNIFEGKQYAVKKLFINHKNQLNNEKMEIILNESIKEVNILSQHSHPNIIRFYTCWLQIANLNESIAFNKMHYLSSSKSIRSSRVEDWDVSNVLTDSRISFKKRKSRQQLESCVEVSYVSSLAEDSGFEFERDQEEMMNGEIEIRQEPPLHANKHNNIDYQNYSNCQVVSLCGQNLQNPKINKKNSSHPFVPIFALYIQMQLCKQGSLDAYLHRRQSINRTFSFLIIHQLLKGVQYLHSNGLIHRDLKPGNILINKKERLIKIGDFGLSIKINENIQYGKVGTPSYIAPEIIQKRQIKKQQLPLIDVYSIGVIYYQLLNLFNMTTKHEKLQKINQLKFGTVELNNEFKLQKKLIKLMTRSNNRISIREIFEKKQYKELMQMMQRDAVLMESWNNIDGLAEVKPID